MENTLLFIRVIREIRGGMSLVAACRAMPSFPSVKTMNPSITNPYEAANACFPAGARSVAYTIRKLLISMIISDNFNADLGLQG
jgi:hypothetical protein